MTDNALVPVEDHLATIMRLQDSRAKLTLTPALAWWVCALEDGADLPDRLPQDIMTEAKRLAALAEHLMAPVPSRVLRPWLALIATHYATAKGATSEEAASMWAATIDYVALAGMPAGVFTRANLAEVLARTTVYGKLPTADQLVEVLAPDRDNLERRANALRRVAQLGRDRA